HPERQGRYQSDEQGTFRSPRPPHGQQHLVLSNPDWLQEEIPVVVPLDRPLTITLRDFFVTLFFVSLGLKVPRPTGELVGYTLAVAGFVLASRLLTVFPVLYAMKQGVRVGVLTSINLAQVSEFSLILVSLGVAAGHIASDTASIIVMAMVLTSTLSTYTIPYNHGLYRWLETPLGWLGFRDRFASPDEAHAPGGDGEHGAKIMLLGFYRNASSFLEELEAREPEMLKEVLVLDFNPNVHRELRRRGIACIYADISQMALLREAGITKAEWVLSTVPDSVLVGITNLTLVRQVRRLAPDARIVATAETVASALQMYAAGADYVLAPRLASADALFEALEHDKAGSLETLREQHISALKRRHEVVS
ncbi:MAG: NAD-binding protein, partial [Chloroflexi bacterium]|nr:NAD-binding protein [Chloroflexota bacterium]